MKVVDPKLELKVLRTVCGGDSTLASGLLPTLTTASFHYPPCIEAFRHVMSSVQSSGAIPDWHALTADPTISDKTRRVLKTCELPAVREAVKAQSLVKTLDRYRQLRGVAAIAETIYGQIDSDQVDVDELTEHISNELVSIRSRNDTKNQLKHLGKGNNSMSVLNELLNGERRPVVPTGFKGFDDRNGGFLYGSLVVIAANSGGGKSALANQLAVNIASIAREDVCIVPLEMTEAQMMARTLGVLTGIDVVRIQQGRLTADEQKAVKRAYKKFVLDLKSDGTRMTIWSPEEDYGIEEMLFMLKPYKYRVVIIDYISLLKGADGDDQVKALGRIARFAKVYAKNTNTVVVLLAQLSDEGQVRYARAIKEHANNLWSWHMNEEESENSILDIRQQKARNQLRFNFQLSSHNSSMRITDVDGDLGSDDGAAADSSSDGKPARKPGRSKTASGSSKEDDSYLDDLNDDQGDGDD